MGDNRHGLSVTLLAACHEAHASRVQREIDACIDFPHRFAADNAAALRA